MFNSNLRDIKLAVINVTEFSKIPTSAATYYFEVTSMTSFFPGRKIDFKTVYVGIVVGSGAFILNAIVGFTFSQFTGINPELFHSENFLVFIAFLMFVCFVAPFFEECLFRGYLQRLLTKKSRSAVFGPLVSNLLWCIVHLPNGVRTTVIVFLPGLLFAWALQKSNSTWIPIIAHSTMNLMVIVTLYLILGMD